MSGGWTVAESATLLRPATASTSKTSGPTAATPTPKMSAHGQSSHRAQSGNISKAHHVRFSNDVTSIRKESNGQEEDLDSLLDGLDKLTETLPDLLKEKHPSGPVEVRVKPGIGKRSPSPPPRPPLPAVFDAGSSRSTATPSNHTLVITEDTDQRFKYSTLPSNFSLGAKQSPVLKRPRSPLNRQKSFDESDYTLEESSKLFPSVRKTRQLLQSRDTYNLDESSTYSGGENTASGSVTDTIRQPYHTLQHSKPFSYIRSNNSSSMPPSRNLSRTSSREALYTAQPGLESPGLLRKILGTNDSSSTSSTPMKSTGITIEINKTEKASPNSNGLSDTQPKNGVTEIPIHYSPNPSQPFNKSTSNYTSSNKGFQSHMTISNGKPYQDHYLSDEEASLSWLERQQRKLSERREMDKRRWGHFKPAADSQPHQRDSKPTMQSHYQARSETTTDGYASDLASMLYSETSTRESSPHKYSQAQPVYNIPVRVEQPLHQSTPKYPSSRSDYGYGRASLSRQKSDTSFDRHRPLHLNRRLRYESESESELTSDLFRGHFNNGGNLYGSNTSIDSALHWGTLSQPGSRPITPAFPSSATPSFHNTRMGLLQRANGHMRSASPAGSMYQQGSEYNTISRRGSVSSEPAEVSPAHVKLVKDNYKFWYKPNISREEAISILRHKNPGTFVVRDSNSFPGAFGLALKVATPPPDSQPKPGENELIRHFLIEPTSKGVKLKGYQNEPVFASLSALVYQHTLTQLALPTRLVLPQADLFSGRRDSVDSKSSTSSQMQQLLAQGAACSVMYLLTMEMDSLTGPAAIKKTVSQLFRGSHNAASPLLVHFKVSGQGITLTDTARRRFFRKHFNTQAISFCGIDPDDRRWSEEERDGRRSAVSQRIFGFVARKPTSRSQNQCHIFAEHDPEQPARAIVNFVNKVMLNGSNSRSDVV